jgi:hypothetical protein
LLSRRSISRELDEIQTSGFGHGMKLDEWRLTASIHKDEQASVVL